MRPVIPLPYGKHYSFDASANAPTPASNLASEPPLHFIPDENPNLVIALFK